MIRTPSQIWGAPILRGNLTTIGQKSALLGDGIWDAVSAVALGIPCLLGVWFGMRRTPAQRSAL
ncbi:MAG: hypothetical protein RR763_08460 [Massilia sp.]